MKIIFLQDDFPPYAKGGAGIVANSLAVELVKKGNKLTVITTVQDRTKAGSFMENGMRIERIYSDYAQRWRSWRSLYNPATVPTIARVITEIKPDVVHAHNLHYHISYWALHLARKSGAKVFLTAHDVMLFHYGKLSEFIDKNDIECKKNWNYKVNPLQQLRAYRFWYNPFRNIVIKRLLKNVDKIFAVSSALKNALEQNGIKNIEVLHNGIDTVSWEVSAEAVSAFIKKYNLKNKKVILFGGRISGLKGGNIILEALRDIVRKEPNTILLLLGTRSAYTDKLMQRAKEWGIEQNMISIGWLSGDELRAAYNAVDIIIVPSVYLDPFPTVVLEAMACGKPVVGSCFGGIPEVVVNEKTGYILNPYNHIAFVNYLKDLLTNETKCNTFGELGKKRVKESFALKDSVVSLIEQYVNNKDITV